MPSTIGAAIGASAAANPAAAAVGKGAFKGVLKTLGLGSPWGWAAVGAQIGLSLLWRKIFRPKIEPLPVKSINVTGGREVARYVVGQWRVKLEWTDATTLPTATARDNHKQFIACVSEGACSDITRIWVDEENWPFITKPADVQAGTAADPNHYIPTDSDFLLPENDVQDNNFPTRYAFELRKKFKADGTEAESARTSGNPRYAIAPGRQYNGNAGQADWDSAPTRNTTLFRDPEYTCAEGYQLTYDEHGNAVCQPLPGFGLPMDTVPATPDYTRSVPENFALEVKVIDDSYKLNGIAWVQVNWFDPFYDSENRSTKFYKQAPSVEVLMKGILMTTPYSSVPVYTDNPAAILHWLDTQYRGIDAAKIDAAAYKAAYDHCEELITYRFGSATPADSLGDDGDHYARADGRIYVKAAGAWSDQGAFQGDYEWLAAQGTNGVYTMPRYRFSGEIVIGSDIEDTYEQILACCGDGRRYSHKGLIRYRVGVQRTSRLTVAAKDIWEVGEHQPWMPATERVNKLSARLAQSQENDWLPDDLAYTDTAAVARDGETREAQFSLDGETNPLRAYNLLKIQLGLLRSSEVWPMRIGWMPNMEQRDIEPLDVITVTHPEYGLVDQECQVISVVHLRDRTAAVLLRRYEGSLYESTLTLPGIARRPIRYSIPPPPDVTGLDTAGFAIATAGGVELHLDAFVDTQAGFVREYGFRHDGYGQVMDTATLPMVAHDLDTGIQFEAYFDTANLPMVAHELQGAGLFASLLDTAALPMVAHEFDTGGVLDWKDETADIDTGLVFKATGLTVYYTQTARRATIPSQVVPNSRDFTFTGNEGNKEGFWLYHPDLTAQTNDTAILGTNLKFERIGAESRGSWTDVGTGRGGRARLRVDFEKASASDARTDLTAAQRAAYRFVFVDRAIDGHRVRTIPVADIAEPYVWPDNVDLRNFLAAARQAGRTIDLYVIDTRAKFTGADAFRHHGFTGRVVTYDQASMLMTAHELETGAATFTLRDQLLTPSFASGLLFRQLNVRMSLYNARYVGNNRQWGWASTGAVSDLHVSASRTITGAGGIRFPDTRNADLAPIGTGRVSEVRFALPTGHGLNTAAVQNWALVFVSTATNVYDLAMGSSNSTITVEGNEIVYRVRAGARGPAEGFYSDLRNFLMDTVVMGLRSRQNNFVIQVNPTRTTTLHGNAGTLDALCIVDTTNSGVNLTSQPFSAASG